MGNKKKKYNARFPPARIKKIMQTDEEVGKVAAAVPVIISRALELFVESLIVKTCKTTQAKSAKTLTPAHIKHTIQSEKTFDFLKDLVANVPDQSTEDDLDNVTFPHPKLNRVTPPEIRRTRAPRGRRPLHAASPGPSHRKARKTSSDTSQIDDDDEEDDAGDDDDEDDDEDESVSEASCDPSPQAQPCRPSVIVSSPPCSTNGSLPINYSMHATMASPAMMAPPTMMAPPAMMASPAMMVPPGAPLLPPSGVPIPMPRSNLICLPSFNTSSVEDDDYDA